MGTIAVIYNIGAIFGGILFGSLQSASAAGVHHHRGAAGAAGDFALGLFGHSELLAIGAFLVQFFVQGAWGVVPAHLNELSPADRARHLSRAPSISSAI